MIGFEHNGTKYWYDKNLQGDITAIRNASGTLVAQYEYDAWGKHISITDGSGNDVSDNPNHIANINPFRYRGYYFDVEIGWYYLNARYYDPNVGRFLSIDSILGANGGLQGYNLFAYCNNNPVNNCDPSGQFFISALLVGGLIVGGGLLLSGCSAKPEPKPEPYKSADDAARAFSEQVYSSSLYIRHEYSTEIYSRTVKGETTYNYNPP